MTLFTIGRYTANNVITMSYNIEKRRSMSCLKLIAGFFI